MCLTVTLISNLNSIDIYNVFLISYSTGNVVIYGTLTVAEPLILKNVDYNVIFLSNFLF